MMSWEILIAMAAAAALCAQTAVIRVDAAKVLHRMPDLNIGVNLEDLNYQTYGGVYSQLIYGESFQENVDSDVLGLAGRDRLRVYVEENARGEFEVLGWAGNQWLHDSAREVLGLPKKGNGVPVALTELPPAKRAALLERATGTRQVPRHWRAFETGPAKGEFGFERAKPWVGRQSQRITFRSGTGEIGIDNAGLNRWGMNLAAGRIYEGLLRLRAERPVTVYVSLRDASGARVLAEKAVPLKPSPDYQRIEFTLTPSGSDEHGRFAISLKQPGEVTAGYAFLQPGSWGRFKGLPLRKDLVEALIAQGVKVIRYNGSMVNRCPDGDLYKWKKMIGPRDARPPYHGKFDPYASHGFAIFDALNLAEAAGFLAIPGVRTDETAEDMADFVEYVNGAPDTPWGKRRTADGHPAPYNLRHLEIGNEERLDAEYCERFEKLASAVWSRDASMILLISVNLGGAARSGPNWDIGPNGETVEELQNAARLVRFARERKGVIWWDNHYQAMTAATSGAESFRLANMRALKRSLAKLVPDYDLKFAPLEENGNSYNHERALAHARNAHELARMPFLTAIAVANSFQAWQQEIVWPQGKTFFTASKVWYQPAYSVDQMISRNSAPNVVAVDAGSAPVDVLARTTDDRKAVVVQVVNASAEAVRSTVAIEGFRPKRATALELAGDPKTENTLEEPERLTPKAREWPADRGAAYTFRPYSFTVLRFE